MAPILGHGFEIPDGIRRLVEEGISRAYQDRLISWRFEQSSNPCFSLERVVSWSVATRTYTVVATGGCHDVFEFEWFVTLVVQTHSASGPSPLAPRPIGRTDTPRPSSPIAA
jgi:hypothetical protein